MHSFLFKECIPDAYKTKSDLVKKLGDCQLAKFYLTCVIEGNTKYLNKCRKSLMFLFTGKIKSSPKENATHSPSLGDSRTVWSSKSSICRSRFLQSPDVAMLPRKISFQSFAGTWHRRTQKGQSSWCVTQSRRIVKA